MQTIREKSRDLPVRATADVIVVGGGIAGFAASIAASRMGAKVILLELSSYVGGVVVEGPLEALMTFNDENSTVVGGVADEFVQRLIDAGGSFGNARDSTGYCSTITPYDSEIAKLVIFQMLIENDVKLLLHSMMVGVIAEDKKISGVIIESKSGREALLAKSFIDCTGDGDMAFHAGARFMQGRDKDGLTQPMTLLFKVAGVNINDLKSYVKNNINEFKLEDYNGHDLFMHLWGFSNILNDGYIKRKISLKRNEMHVINTIRPGELIINFTRVNGDGTNVSDLTYGQVNALKQAHELLDWLRESIPAFKNSYISHTGRIGVRESRRILGEYVLTAEDILTAAKFNDTVAKGAFPIDIHEPRGNGLVYEKVIKAYNIPSRCLYSIDYNNLLMAGRCISATHEAIGSTRISVTCMATGQAAGVMAGICANDNISTCDVDYKVLRNNLEEQGVIL